MRLAVSTFREVALSASDPGAAKTGCDQRSGVVHARVATEVAELA